MEMLSKVKILFKNHNGKTATHENIGDGIPAAPDQGWMHKIKNFARGGHAHENPSTNVAPSSVTNGPIPMAALSPTPQQPEVRDPVTASIDNSIAPRPSIVDASRASDGAPVQGTLDTTDAQAAFQFSLDPETISLKPEQIATPNAEKTPAAPLGKKAELPIPSSKAASDRQSGTAVDAIAPVISQMSGIAMDDNVPAIAQVSPVKEKGKNLDHGPKQKQKVLTEPASREYDQSQIDQFAKRNVHQALEHHLKGYERVRVAICVDIEYYKGLRRRVCVTCFDEAVDKASDIESILSKIGKSLHGFPYVVRRREGTKIFGYRGSDVDRIDATAIATENSGDEPAIYPGAANRIHNGNYYNTVNYNSRHSDGSDGGHQVFSNSPYWTKGSMMVEIFCGGETDGNITGAPIRVRSKLRDGSFTTSLWTCGGIIKVGGTDYGLTTAHPFVLRDSVRPQDSPSEKQQRTDPNTEMKHSMDNGPFGGSDDFFSAEEHPEKYWQAMGKVSYYALANMGSIPSNNDWLLFELPKHRSMWNSFRNNPVSRVHTSGSLAVFTATGTLAVFTARGTLAAHLLEGTAFLILGSSPFEVLKIWLENPLRKSTYVQHRKYGANNLQGPVTLAHGSCAAANSSE
jgi:hypothetical protein